MIPAVVRRWPPGQPGPELYRAGGKRALDLAVSVGALLLLAPLMVLVALLVRRDSPGPALFVQARVGRAGRTFRLHKFRTMTLPVPAPGASGGGPEVTRVGHWLRRFKIDEWPQLLDVVAGHMSLVGPRPALPAQADAYGASERRRLTVRPGMTGLSQVHGGVYLTWQERLAWDARYVDELSLGLDLRILARTLVVVLLGEGALAPPHARRDSAAFVADVTVPDGTVLPPRAAFDKTWRLRNTGSTAWGAGYALGFTAGAPLGGPERVPLAREVGPGETVDITVPMTAPDGPGRFTSVWRMTDPRGVPFAAEIWAEIRVATAGGALSAGGREATAAVPVVSR